MQRVCWLGPCGCRARPGAGEALGRGAGPPYPGSYSALLGTCTAWPEGRGPDGAGFPGVGGADGPRAKVTATLPSPWTTCVVP